MSLLRKTLHMLIAITLVAMPFASSTAPIRFGHATVLTVSLATVPCHQENIVRVAEGRTTSSADCRSCSEQDSKGFCPASSDCTHGCVGMLFTGIAPACHSMNWGRDTLYDPAHDIPIYSRVLPPPIPPPILVAV